MNDNDRRYNKRTQIMQAKKTVQCRIINTKTTSQKSDNFIANNRKSCKKVSNNSSSSKTHLTSN